MLTDYLIAENSRLQKELDRLTRELIEANHAMVDSLQKANEAEKLASLGLLIAGVAHEINNPTTYIRGNLEILQKYWDLLLERTGIAEIEEVAQITMDIPKILRDSYQGTTRIMEIINALRIFSRQGIMDFTEINLQECVQDSYLIVRNEFCANKIHFVNKMGDEYLGIQASRSKIEQIFINLFLNAVNALQDMETSKRRCVEMGIVEKTDQWVKVYVKDNGCGISPENLKKVFMPFFTTRKSEGGTGLGLSIVYGIVNEYGGEIVVTSEEASGTVFTIIFPLAVRR
jgi:two-component system NtrC family sensor kinase